MKREQGTLFDGRNYRGTKPQAYSITPPTADMSILATVPAYHAYLSSTSESRYTPDDFKADIVAFGQFMASKRLSDVQRGDIQDWIGRLRSSLEAKTVSRKVSAIGNYFRWLTDTEKVLPKNPAYGIRAAVVMSPPPDLLFENECKRLLDTASRDPRAYLLIMLLLETGIKKAELLELKVGNFDFSNKYQPELWVKHSGKQAAKDRALKLPAHIAQVFDDYVSQYDLTDVLFPYTGRFIETVITDAAKQAEIHKQVTPGLLRDMFVVRSVKGGMKLEDALEKIGLSKNSYDYARKRYGLLVREAL